MSAVVSSFWQVYNSEESWLPFYLPLAFWSACWLYSRQQKFDYSKWAILHGFHHVGAISQGLISMYYNDNTIFNERITILWSIPYFIVDFADCVYRKHFTYTFHGLVCLVLGIMNYQTPLYRELRMNSKADLIETSSLLLYQTKKSRNPVLFFMFAFVYTLCRIVWIPIMMKELRDHGVQWTDVTLILLSGFYALNWWWYLKILKILYKGLRGESVDHPNTTKSSSSSQEAVNKKEE
jgi:hypothetical protein